MKKYIIMICIFSFVLTLIIPGCKNEIENPVNNDNDTQNLLMKDDEVFLEKHKRFSWITLIELLHARIATARYRNINNAIADGYADINVILPNMGYHYLKAENLDAEFEVGKPELLVYSPHPVTGHMRLVAVEYAAPVSLLQNPPEGFTGDADVWDFNEQFQLWTLHAWVWYFNPDGVFNPTNSLIP